MGCLSPFGAGRSALSAALFAPARAQARALAVNALRAALRCA